MPPRTREWLMLPLIALAPLCLYLGLGYRGNDYKFHMTSWIELHSAFQAHEWLLGWADWAQYGFGEPRFCFYPPLSLLLGAALVAVLPLKLVPGAMIWLLLTSSGLAMYWVAGRFVARHHRLAAALLYMFNPYFITTLLVRFAIAEAWVVALLPFTFFFAYRALAERDRRSILLLALMLAGGWLSNIPAAITLFYAVGALGVVFALMQRSVLPMIGMCVSQGIALGLAAFRLLPALQEKQWVSSDALLLYNYRDTLQFVRLRPHLIELCCGIDMVIAFAVMLLAVRQHVRAERRWSLGVISLLALAAVGVLFQLPLSVPLWEGLPELKFVSFPFRFLPLLNLGSVLMLFARGVLPQLRRQGVVLLILAALFPLLPFAKLKPFERYPSTEAALATWRGGFEGVREYVPAGVPHDEQLIPREMAQRAEGPFHSRQCSASVIEMLPNEKRMRTVSSAACTITLNTFYYPFWKAALESGTPLTLQADAGGLLTFTVPAGEHQVSLRFSPATHLRALSTMAASSLFLIVLILLVTLRKRARSMEPAVEML